MRKLLAVTLMSLFCAGGVAASAMENPDMPVDVTPDGDPAVAPEDDAKPAPPEAEADSQDGIMKNFTRHRPGACPEGPPCKLED